MGYTVRRLIEIADAEVGYLEKASNSNLDSKTANAGENNYTKYARDLKLAGYYNLNGYAWCDMFTDWCFYMLCNQSKEKALSITCQADNNGAGCAQSMHNYKKAGRFFTAPLPGDQIFFDWQGSKSDADHTGIVYKVDATKVYTIEGNTGPMQGLEDNGDGVYKKEYSLNYSLIVGYGRPLYDADTVSDKIVSDPDNSNSLDSSEDSIITSSATKHNFFDVSLKVISPISITVKIEQSNIEECEWKYSLIDLFDNTSVTTKELVLDKAMLDNFVLVGLKPSRPYVLKIIASTAYLQSSQQLFFVTTQDTPGEIQNLMVTFDNNDISNKKCTISFKPPKTWGRYGLSLDKGYRASLIINGKVITYRDDLFTVTANSVSEKLYITEFFNTKGKLDIGYGDSIQIGVQTWVKDQNGDIIFGSSSPVCSKPAYIENSLRYINNIFIKIANKFKQAIILHNIK